MKSILNLQSAANWGRNRGVLAAFGLAAFFITGHSLQAASPDFQNSAPRGGQRGAEVKVTFTGNRLSDITQVVFHKPGIVAKDVKAVDARKVEATLVVAPDCEMGEHQMRLLGKSGFSYARTFWIGQYPAVQEVEPNDEFETPQAIPMNVTVEGVAKPEEVDFYRVTAKKGDRISVEMEALRINNLRNAVAMDPYVAILDKNRFELAVSDDSALLKQESVASVVAPEDGEYVIEIRDASYQGRGVYRAHIGTFPRPLGVYPAGGKAGSDMEFTFLGDPKGRYKAKMKLPGPSDSHYVFGNQGGQIPVSGNKVRVSEFDNVLEAEPNNTYKDKIPEAKALPLAFNGILQSEGDEDYFKFSAKANQRYRFRSYANRLGTPVDTVVYIYDSKMKSIGGNDDADGSKDSRVDFRAPADGEYFLRVKDMLGRGGENFVYRVESEPYTPKLTVTMPEMLRRDNQYRKQFNIPQGNQYAMNVNVRRENFSGDLVFDLPKLPAGVTWEAGTIPKNLSQFPILFKAAPAAPVAGGLYSLNLKSNDPKNPVSGTFKQEIHFVRGNPNGTSYYQSANEHLPIAVAEKVPFNVTIDQPKVPLVRNGTLKMKIRVQRHDGYDKKILTRMLWRPPGISCPSTMTFSEKATELEYELNANASAEINEWKITVLAESTGANGVMMTAAPFITLKVEEPFVKMKMHMTSVKQGQAGELLCELENLRAYEGQADVQMFGLPAKTTSSALKADKNTKELRFPIKSSDDSRVGQTKNLFCTLVLMQNGEPISHRIGMGGVIRVDPKPKEPAKPVAKAPAKPAAKVAENKPKPAKPLSRLEQLRLEAKKQAEGQ